MFLFNYNNVKLFWRLISKTFVIFKNNYEKKTVTEKRTVRFKTPIEESLELDNSDDNMQFLGPIK